MLYDLWFQIMFATTVIVIVFLWPKAWKKEMVWVIHGRLMFTYFHILELEKVPLVHMKKDQASSQPKCGEKDNKY